MKDIKKWFTGLALALLALSFSGLHVYKRKHKQEVKSRCDKLDYR